MLLCPHQGALRPPSFVASATSARQHPGYEVKQGRFAGAVRTDHGAHLALLSRSPPAGVLRSIINASAPHAAEPMVCMTLRWSEGDSNPRSLLLDFRDEGRVQGGVARTSITIFPNGSRFAAEPGGTTQVESYSSMMQGPALGSRRSERLMIAVSHQPRAGPK